MAEDNRLEPRDVIYTAFIPPEWVEHYIRATDTPSQWLAQEVQKAEGSQPLEDMVLAQYHDFRDVFSKEAFDELPLQKAWDHAIDLTPGTELPHSQTFPLSPAEQKELDDFLWENLVNTCNDWLPQRWESPQGPADLASAIGLALQSPGL